MAIQLKRKHGGFEQSDIDQLLEGQPAIDLDSGTMVVGDGENTFVDKLVLSDFSEDSDDNSAILYSRRCKDFTPIVTDITFRTPAGDYTVQFEGDSDASTGNLIYYETIDLSYGADSANATYKCLCIDSIQGSEPNTNIPSVIALTILKKAVRPVGAANLQASGELSTQAIQTTTVKDEQFYSVTTDPDLATFSEASIKAGTMQPHLGVTGKYSASFGRSTSNLGTASLTAGSRIWNDGSDVFAAGQGLYVTDSSQTTVLGANSKVKGLGFSLVSGYYNNIDNDGTVSSGLFVHGGSNTAKAVTASSIIGNNNSISKLSYNIFVGNNNKAEFTSTATKQHNIVVGSHNELDATKDLNRVTTIGNYNKTSRNYTTMIGTSLSDESNTNGALYTTILGSFNAPTSKDYAIIFGAGNNDGNRKNILLLPIVGSTNPAVLNSALNVQGSLNISGSVVSTSAITAATKVVTPRVEHTNGVEIPKINGPTTITGDVTFSSGNTYLSAVYISGTAATATVKLNAGSDGNVWTSNGFSTNGTFTAYNLSNSLNLIRGKTIIQSRHTSPDYNNNVTIEEGTIVLENQSTSPSTKATLTSTNITCPNFTGLASKATADKNGNDIVSTYATKTELQQTENDCKEYADTELAKKADKATTLSGYGITDAYTKSEVDTKDNLIRSTSIVTNNSVYLDLNQHSSKEFISVDGGQEINGQLRAARFMSTQTVNLGSIWMDLQTTESVSATIPAESIDVYNNIGLFKVTFLWLEDPYDNDQYMHSFFSSSIISLRHNETKEVMKGSPDVNITRNDSNTVTITFSKPDLPVEIH